MNRTDLYEHIVERLLMKEDPLPAQGVALLLSLPPADRDWMIEAMGDRLAGLTEENAELREKREFEDLIAERIQTASLEAANREIERLHREVFQLRTHLAAASTSTWRQAPGV